MKDRAYKICRDFLSGTWKNISSTDMVFKTVSGGMSNLLYYCSLPETHTPIAAAVEPSQVLLRMYGQLHDGARTESTITESVIFMMLSERKLGPKLYGIFPGGRLEEYIPARALSCQELHNAEISAIIARKLAGVHKLQVPINKEPSWLFDMMTRWLSDIRQTLRLDSVPMDKRLLAKQLLSADFESEIDWLRVFLRKLNSPVLFCHNDLQEGNILFPGSGSRVAGDDRIVFIDFEYCSYNYRGFDVANHFCEWTYDYSSPDFPHFTTNPERYPSRDEQLHFIRAYLNTIEGETTPELEDQLLKESAAFTLASHLLWTIWAIYNASTSKIAFGYWDYGVARLEDYFQWKKQFVSQTKRPSQ